MPLAAARSQHTVTGMHGNAERTHAIAEFPCPARTRIHYSRHAKTTLRKIDGREIGAVVAGVDHRALACGHAIAVKVVPHGRGQHHAGAVVIGEHQRALHGTAGQHHLTRTDPPPALARQMGSCVRAQMRSDALDRGQHVVVVIARDGGAVQHLHVRVCRQRGQRGRHPRDGRLAIDALALGEQAAAWLFLFVDQQDASPGWRGLQRRCKPRRPGTHDQQIAVQILAMVVLRITFAWGLAQAREPAHCPLVPVPARPHHRLVVERGREQRLEKAEHSEEIETHRGPGVLAAGTQPRIERLQRGAHVGFGPRPFLQLHECVGLFLARRHQAARTVQLEAAPQNTHTVREQRRGERIARIAAIGLAVEEKTDGRGGVDTRAWQTVSGFAHARASGNAGTGSVMPYTARMRCETVSRATLNHWRQP